MKDAQILVRADGGGEGGVIFNSALSLLQGLFPATDNYNTTLANGTNVVGPLGGYQTVPSTVLFPCIATMLTDIIQLNLLNRVTMFLWKAGHHAMFGAGSMCCLYSLMLYITDVCLCDEQLLRIRSVQG